MLDKLILWLLSGLVNQLNRMEDRIMAVQDDLKTRAAAIEAAIAAERAQISEKLTAVAAEIQSLKDQIAGGVAPDFTELDAAIADIQNIYTPGA
jgi:predicted  nucleic acid-binding Zn-ribbon protein